MAKPRPVNLDIGSVFGELTVLSGAEAVRYGQSTHWKVNVRCSCGAEKEVRLNDLRKGAVKTCNNKIVHFGYADRSMPAFNMLYEHVYKGRALKRGLTFELTSEQFRVLTRLPCHYCGIEPSGICKQQRSEYVYTGVDRMNNSLGYVATNVVPCCGICNHAKHTMCYHDFLAWIRRVANLPFRPESELYLMEM